MTSHGGPTRKAQEKARRNATPASEWVIASESWQIWKARHDYWARVACWAPLLENQRLLG